MRMVAKGTLRFGTAERQLVNIPGIMYLLHHPPLSEVTPKEVIVVVTLHVGYGLYVQMSD